MMKQYLGHVFASSLLLAGAAEVYAADVNLPASTTRIQRSFVNLDIQKPVISSSWTYLDADPALTGDRNVCSRMENYPLAEFK